MEASQYRRNDQLTDFDETCTFIGGSDQYRRSRKLTGSDRSISNADRGNGHHTGAYTARSGGSACTAEGKFGEGVGIVNIEY